MINLEKPGAEEIERWRREAEIESEEPEIYLDVIGDDRRLEASCLSRLEPGMDNLWLAGIVRERLVTEDRDIRGLAEQRKKLRSSSGGIRDEEFYQNYYGEDSECFFSNISISGLQDSIEKLYSIEEKLARKQEYMVNSVRFGMGIENGYEGVLRARNLAEAYRDIEKQIGFQLVYSYTGDPEATEAYKESNPFCTSSEEGIPGIVSVGREEDMSVYTAGPRNLEVKGMKWDEILDEPVTIESVEGLIL